MARHMIVTFTVIYFIQAWTLGVDSKMVNLPLRGSNLIHLNMSLDSVDDSYQGCEDKMLRKVQDRYLPAERQNDKDFNQAWTSAEMHYKPKKSSTLSKYESLAIQVYVNATSNIYKSFNEATRTQKNIYNTTFKYHSLHFFLTRALQKLNKKKRCFQTFRGTKVTFQGDKDQKMRFGQFTSSSLDKKITKVFGNHSCFEITTCLGAPLGEYASQMVYEKEVLIPPYEVFKITKVMKKENQKDPWCEIVFNLKSTKKEKSDLKCKLV